MQSLWKPPFPAMSPLGVPEKTPTTCLLGPSSQLLNLSRKTFWIIQVSFVFFFKSLPHPNNSSFQGPEVTNVPLGAGISLCPCDAFAEKVTDLEVSSLRHQKDWICSVIYFFKTLKTFGKMLSLAKAESCVHRCTLLSSSRLAVHLPYSIRRKWREERKERPFVLCPHQGKSKDIKALLFPVRSKSEINSASISLNL